MENSPLYERLIDPSFDMSTLDEATCMTLATDLMEGKEVYQKAAGRLAYRLVPPGKNVKAKVKDLCLRMEQSTGRKISFSSLFTYRWVYETILPYENKVPPEWSYTSLRRLSGMDDIEGWIDQGIEGGWSSAKLNLEMSKHKGKDKKICPTCNRVMA